MSYMTGLSIEITHKEDNDNKMEFSVDDGMDEVVAEVTMKDLINLRDHLTSFIEGDMRSTALTGFGRIN